LSIPLLKGRLRANLLKPETNSGEGRESEWRLTEARRAHQQRFT
jgi:hypothetical protein